LVTISDVARLAGVSTATVSRTINRSGYVSRETRARVHEAIEELGYVPGGGVRRSGIQTNLLIALIIPDITNPFFPAVVRGVDDCIGNKGYRLVLCNSDGGVDKELAIFQVLIEKRIDGLICAPAVDGRAIIPLARKHSVPTVLLDRIADNIEIDCVATDHRLGAYKAVQHLLDLGHRRIAHIAGPREVPSAGERYSGYIAALEDHGISLDPKLIFQGDYTQYAGRWALEGLMALDNPPTAVLASNDLCAVGLIEKAMERGIRIPEDLSVCGFDDIEYATIVSPKLTTVAQDKYELGKLAAEYLLRRILSPNTTARYIKLEPDLVVRESTTVPQFGIR